MGAFEYRQAEEIRDVFARQAVKYLFLGKSGATLFSGPTRRKRRMVAAAQIKISAKKLPAALQTSVPAVE